MVRPTLTQTKRNVVVGLAATAVDLGLLSVGVEWLGLKPSVVGPVALAAGVAVQLVGTKKYAFRDRSRDWLRQTVLFLGVELLAYTANVVAFTAVTSTTRAPYTLVRIAVGAIVYFGISLPLWTRIFDSPARRLENEAPT